MRYRYFFIVALVLSAGVCYGQSSWKYRSDNYFGVSTGEIGSAVQVQTVNGLYKGPWFLGLGAGLDYYRYRSIPLFVSVSRDLVSIDRRSRLFVFADGGINLPWYKRALTTYQQELVISSTFRAGAWGSAGLGYEWRLSTHNALLVSAGYSRKELREKLVGKTPCYTSYCQLVPETYFYDYDNNTFLFLVGFRF